MKQGITTVFALALVIGLAGNAFAGDDPRFDIGKRAVAAAGIAVTASNPGKDFRGDEAVVLDTDLTPKQVLNKFVDAMTAGKELDGVKVVGMGFLVYSKAWGVTLLAGEEQCSIKITEKGKGAQILIKGKRASVPVEDDVKPDTGTVK